MPARAPTAYFLFAAEQRSKIQEELVAQKGEKVGVAAIAKAIGERWQQLSDSEKDQYKQLAAEKAEALRGTRYELLDLLGSSHRNQWRTC